MIPDGSWCYGPDPDRRAAGSDPHIALGVGGILGGYTGARMQSRLPDALIRRVVGILAAAIAVRYLWSGLT
jgi:uncharacterized membrane protein YfcA